MRPRQRTASSLPSSLVTAVAKNDELAPSLSAAAAKNEELSDSTEPPKSKRNTLSSSAKGSPEFVLRWKSVWRRSLARRNHKPSSWPRKELKSAELLPAPP
jgi:hypothetical protein